MSLPPDIHAPVVVRVTSTLDASPAAVWARVTTPAGIRDELAPWVGMSMPPGLKGRTIADADDLVGRPLGRAWLLLLRVLPVDYDDMTLVDVDPGRSFHERSSMLTLRSWEHLRSLEPDGDGTRLTDELRATLRRPLAAVPGAHGVVRALVTALFGHRHRRLVRRFGGRTAV